MNKFGLFSILTVLSSILLFFILRGSNADLFLIIVIQGCLSLLGIIFAVVSKKRVPGIIGVVSNSAVLVFAFFLLLAKGIGG
ncbi:hypothetical protein AAGG74_16415 [Bacillus mexicanus]|uniref:hypothetical protein n=1 Tax=Bacillus mexicanus TaxID=2834415 RepID=UPI003D21C4D6